MSAASALSAAVVIALLGVSGRGGAAQQPAQPPVPQSAPPQRSAEPTGTGVIAGQILAGDNGRPIAGAVVRLLSYDVMRVAKSIATDGQGRFEYTALLAGRYQLEATADGYLNLQFGQRPSSGPVNAVSEAGKPIDLREGERFATANITLPRRSAIEGTIVDEFGDPMPNVQMLTSQAQFVIGTYRLMPAPGSGVTDDKGRFRITNLPPGDYYVSASAGAFSTPNAPGGFAVTYFPGTADVAAAKPVRVGVGGDLGDVSFPLVAGRTSRISGTITDDQGRSLGAAVLLATSDLGTISAFSTARAQSNPDGTFTFRNVPPGSYVVQGFGPPVGGGNLGRAPFGSVKVTLAGDDRDGIRLVVRAGTVARGRIVMDKTKANSPDLRPADVRVAFGPIEFESNAVMGGPPDMVTNADWTFSASNQFGLRIVRVDVRSPDWMVRRASLGGRDVTDAPFDFRTGDVNDLEIVLTDVVSTIGGSVMDEERQRTTSYSVIVFAVDEAKWKFPFSRFVQLARPNQDGSFKTTGLPPADYFVVALAGVQGGEWQDPQFLEKLKASAITVSLTDGGARPIELSLTRRPD